MAKKANNYSQIYVRDENLQKWILIKHKSDFVNWCLSSGKLEDYIKNKELNKKREV